MGGRKGQGKRGERGRGEKGVREREEAERVKEQEGQNSPFYNKLSPGTHWVELRRNANIPPFWFNLNTEKLERDVADVGIGSSRFLVTFC